VSANAGPVRGCGTRRLGALRYVATASPGFFRRWFAAGVDAESLAQAPCLVFNAKDALQARWTAAAIGRTVAPPVHWLPSSQAFVDATLAGLGWGMNPETLVARHLAEGRLVTLLPDQPLDVMLYWHWSRTVEPALRDLTASVLRAARDYLVDSP
jgi:LysR family transcriptional regulator (chromosome initiation inhibitor)